MKKTITILTLIIMFLLTACSSATAGNNETINIYAHTMNYTAKDIPTICHDYFGYTTVGIELRDCDNGKRYVGVINLEETKNG